MAKQQKEDRLQIRGLDARTVARIKRAAGARGLTVAQYIARLADLHEECRTAADGGTGVVANVLSKLGLATVAR